MGLLFVRVLDFRLISLTMASLMLTSIGCSCSTDRRPEPTADKASEPSSPELATKAKSQGQAGSKKPQDTTAEKSTGTEQFAAKGQNTKARSGSTQSPGNGNGSSRGAGLSATAASASSAAKESSPEKAAQRAEDLGVKAKGLEEKGELADAFSTTLEAWELVRSHREDQRCQSVATKLARELERLGEKVNARLPGGRNGVLTPDLEIR